MNNQTEGQEAALPKILKNKKRLFPIIVGIAVLLAMLCGIGIYNMPDNRLNRHLEMANKYLEETDYEQAIVEFDKVIAIDPMSAAAYIGKAEACAGLGNYDMAIETMEAGYLAVPEGDDIKDNLIAVYIEALKNSGEGADYEKKLAMYDRLIELGGQDESVLNGLEKCLEQYSNALLKEEKYDEVRALIEKYRDILSGTDFDAFSAQIERQMRETGYASLLSAVQELIMAENYEQVNALVQTEEYQEMLSSLQEDESYYYGDKNGAGQRDGTGIAVYQGHYGAYFYYGSWSEGERSGQGQAVHPTPDTPENLYGVYVGEWANDLPNGKGEERYHVVQSELEEDTGSDSLHQGSYRDALYDGEMYIEVTWHNRGIESYQGTAENGVWELQGEVSEYGSAVIWVNLTDPSSSGMWSDVDDNKDNGIGWLFPSSYWTEDSEMTETE